MYATVQPTTKSRIATPASISASVPALIAAANAPPSDCSTWIDMSMADRGYCFRSTTASYACLKAVDASTFLRSPGRRFFRSDVENAATEKSTLITASSCSLSPLLRGSRGPCTTARTFVFPCSKRAEPSAHPNRPSRDRTLRTSFGRRPSTRSPDTFTYSILAAIAEVGGGSGGTSGDEKFKARFGIFITYVTCGSAILTSYVQLLSWRVYTQPLKGASVYHNFAFDSLGNIPPT